MPPLHENAHEKRLREEWEKHLAECETCRTQPSRCGVGGAREVTYEMARIRERLAAQR